MKLLLLEVAFVLVFLAGVALVFVPAALIIGGLLGVVAVERVSVRRPLAPVSELRGRRSAA
ncbi:hypothetical protein ETD86_34800 [Nonomuraea turkmeniaca]|uniref:Uncharacterized protein n=1 Tax=Nonomuraea turkmeniaca TaxID=103838 RepID=A0A5S4F622_9ACTN|nr:hypothetical protein [Nonomuraea turkmeniaca]TMR11740.1 hypothetical protein ETD86_34800 [Nonomuraea turkmeniaca]